MADDRAGVEAIGLDESDGQESGGGDDDNHLWGSMDAEIAAVLLVLHIQHCEATIWAKPEGGKGGVRRTATADKEQATSDEEHNYAD